MSSTLLNSISESRRIALEIASKVKVHEEISNQIIKFDYEFIQRIAEGLELICLDLLNNKEEYNGQIVECAADAYRLYKILPTDRSFNGLEKNVRMASLAVIGDMGMDASKFLKELNLDINFNELNDWGDITWISTLEIWLRLIRKDGWQDRDAVLEKIDDLRKAQDNYEKSYLNNLDINSAKVSALELVCIYHLSKAAEIFALFITDGVVDGNYQVKQLLDTHFDRIFSICDKVKLVKVERLARLLSACSDQMVENSIWTVTRAVNSKVTQFVKNLVSKGKGDKAIFDVLPPQRRTLAERGLLGSSRRSVVVSLPTSSGKTLIAQFRMLQALNQFEQEKGWVAYLAPTRTLVNQLTRQIRKDFTPLNVVVEQVSPALEIDNAEMNILLDDSGETSFRVLVTTPEKLDLMLRQDWEEKIGRPLTLVVVDEAHNMQSRNRGLTLELLLATINNECKNAQFLLLTPFINNAKEVAEWLGGNNSDDISLSVDWQPNDRLIGIVQPAKETSLNKKNTSFDYSVNLKSVHTSKKTLISDEILILDKNVEVAKTYNQVQNQSALAAIAAHNLQKRGPVIVMHARPDWVWSLAEKIKTENLYNSQPSSNIQLVQKYLKLEYGDQYPLIDLLNYKIGIHHSGISDDVRYLMEWLFENEELQFLVATTTIAQGVNFPITGLVMASHQYPDKNRMIDMPPEDFWNIAGRAGRVGQSDLGVIALAASDQTKADKLEEFINKQTSDLNSTLILLAEEAKESLQDLGSIVYHKPEWSSFLQYLTHTYRQLGKPPTFVAQIEQILRGTFGFERLRNKNPRIANLLLEGIQNYTEYIMRPNQPLKLVDSTGFSLQSIVTILQNKGSIDKNSWDSEKLFTQGDETLSEMMGILLRVPELRDNLNAVLGGDSPDGNKLALILKEWVNGESMTNIALNHFKHENNTFTDALTKCGQNLFGRLTQTSSWGLGALLSITGETLSEEEYSKLNNLPSRVFYGVNNDDAVSLRLLGIPRTAAIPLSEALKEKMDRPIPEIRKSIRELSIEEWKGALGESGSTYQKVWNILEGYEN